MDYCTLWFEGWWQHCCKAHDTDYLMQILRSLADSNLYQCVASSAPTPSLAVVSSVIGAAMWLAVRTFGRGFYRRSTKTPPSEKTP